MSLVFGGLFGLCAGLSANRLLPGHSPGGVLATVAISVTAAFAGGLLAVALALGDDGRFDIPAIAFAMIGSMASLLCFRLYVDQNKH